MKKANYISIAVLCVLVAGLPASGYSKVGYVPVKGWETKGNLKHKYIMGVDDKGGQNGQPAFTIKSNRHIML